MELNATQKEMSLQKIPVGQEVVIVIGEKLNEARIQEYWAGEKEEINHENWNQCSLGWIRAGAVG